MFWSLWVLFHVIVVKSYKVPTCDNLKNHVNYPLLDTGSVCGPMAFTSRIMGGADATLGEFPWMVVLFYKSNIRENPQEPLKLCDGSIITDRYTLTSAHCLADISRFSTLKIVARVGEYDLSTTKDCILTGLRCAPPSLEYDVAEIHIHEEWGGVSSENDIGLIRVKDVMHFTDYVKPICLPITCDLINKNLDGLKVTVAGWGVLREEPKRVNATILQKLVLPVISREECSSAYQGKTVDEGLLCAWAGKGVSGKDVCAGDSGGPLVLPIYHKYYQVGIVSGGDVCNPYKREVKPGVYVRVSSYIPWILDKIHP